MKLNNVLSILSIKVKTTLKRRKNARYIKQIILHPNYDIYECNILNSFTHFVYEHLIFYLHLSSVITKGQKKVKKGKHWDKTPGIVLKENIKP